MDAALVKNLAMQHVNCSHETYEINRRWAAVWDQETEAEAGKICKFDLTNHQEPWTLNENFSCGTSSTRVVMCSKAFDLIQKIDERFGFNFVNEAHPNIWAYFIALAAISILLNVFLILYIWRQRKYIQFLRKQESRMKTIDFNRLTSLNSEILSNEVMNEKMEKSIRDNLVRGME